MEEITEGSLPMARLPSSGFSYFLFWKPNLQKKDERNGAELQFTRVNS